jgi:hypothetical protein
MSVLLTATMLRTLIVDYDTPMEEYVSADTVVETPRLGSGVDLRDCITFNGVKTPERLVDWFKSAKKTEAIKRLLQTDSESGKPLAVVSFKPAPPQITKNKDEIVFHILRSDMQRGYFSGTYKKVEDAYDDVFFLCETLCHNSNPAEITIVLDKAKKEYEIRNGLFGR